LHPFAGLAWSKELDLGPLVFLICVGEPHRELEHWQGSPPAVLELNQPSCPSQAAQVAVLAVVAIAAVAVDLTRALACLMRAVTSPGALSSVKESTELSKEKDSSNDAIARTDGEYVSLGKTPCE
jgi:hypothetical protein